MKQKEKRIFTGFSIFLFLCAVINFAGKQIGAAVCSLGAGIFLWVLSAAYEKIKNDKEHKQ